MKIPVFIWEIWYGVPKLAKHPLLQHLYSRAILSNDGAQDPQPRSPALGGWRAQQEVAFRAVEEELRTGPAVEEEVRAEPAAEKEVPAGPAVEEEVPAGPAVEEEERSAEKNLKS